MEEKSKLNPLVIGVIILVLLLVGAGIWYWRSKKIAVPPTGLGSQLFERAQNPLQNKLPETNPFQAETNPFSDTETNPLKSIIKNPFKQNDI